MTASSHNATLAGSIHRPAPAMLNTPRFAATYTRILARTLGLKREAMLPLLAGTAFTPNDIEFERRELTCPEQYRIIANALALDPRPALGLLVGEQAELSMHGLLGLAAMTSATLHEALQMFSKYHHLRAPFFALRLQLQQQGPAQYLDIVMQNVDTLSAPVDRFLMECYASMMQATLDYIVGRDVTEAQLLLPLADSPDWAAYRAYFHCPVGAAADGCIHYRIPLSLADSPCPTRDDALHQRAEAGCKSLLDKLAGQPTFSGKVEALFSVSQSTLLTLEECAQLLHVSPRTLIRKLKSEATSYQTLVEARQKVLVTQLLREPGLSVEAIALQLGYEHTPSFRRAFKRWFGTTPSAYREQLRDGAG